MPLKKLTLDNFDPEISDLIKLETSRQHQMLEMIASENFVSRYVLEAQASVLTNKYAEGYPGKRYYCGCDVVDQIEMIAIDRAKQLFKCNYANVQPHSGSQANQAVFFALLNPGDIIMGMSLNSGGHLTHGSKVNLSGKWFKSISYNVDPNTHLIDYNQIEELALKYKPKLIIAGYSCYTRKIDFKKFREICDKSGSLLLADISHISGLVATGHHSNPAQYADVITTTTHKTLRGPRGGMILSNSQDMINKLNRSVFPGIQGGPLMHIIASKAVAFKEALDINFVSYISDVIDNAKMLSKSLESRGYCSITGGTDNHMVVLDLSTYNLYGSVTADSLDRAGIVTNKNAIPYDKNPPNITSGIRLGTAACTTRGLKQNDIKFVADIIADVLDVLKSDSSPSEIQYIENRSKHKILSMTEKFPIFPKV
ncbi:serine hydroxymethyltransferase [Rickettsia endosymbiont of Cardiosporidium cionae]|uniref:serine hydroxymethyltransferase n=1 Tax=Rickettsia endosymbiont of Cardiosporidium cionae TaxID=2777155 RepID=UPI0018948CEF|nr:serine hydroxymethyltransferase [Rickettsia endosymbiont of Cardiosporidium cionae]KAF8818109.1 serine hydroxymethyltransferase [Rickettsia endosymbiont of Cardiosporidium cionae]